jgi:hypothetical protein
MGTVDKRLAADLRDRLKLRRAVETGTFRGLTARSLASLFEGVITIELSGPLHERATTLLRDLPEVETVHGDSAEVLGAIASAGIPTFYFLDGHWSGGPTEGVENQCPLLAEIAAIGPGCPDDCMVIDDARLFTAAPPPPHNTAQWPALVEVFDAIRSQRPDHVVTLLADQIIAVPQRAQPAIDTYSARVVHETLSNRMRLLSAAVRGRISYTRMGVRARIRRGKQT